MDTGNRRGEEEPLQQLAVKMSKYLFKTFEEIHFEECSQDKKYVQYTLYWQYLSKYSKVYSEPAASRASAEHILL